MATYPNNGGKPIFHNFQTPVGLISRLHHDEPRLKTNFNTKQPEYDDKGVQIAEFIASVVWDKFLLNSEVNPHVPGDVGLMPMRRLAGQAKEEAWPDCLKPELAPWIVLQPFILDGDNPEHNTERKEFLFGKCWLNVKRKAKYRKVGDKIVYEGAPGVIGPYNNEISPLDIWPGCTGRVSGIMFGTEFAGKKFISVKLDNIQLYQTGERMAGASRPDAASQFEPLMAPPAGSIPTLGGLAAGGLPSIV